MLGIGTVVAALAVAASGGSIDLGGHPGQLALDRGGVWAAVYKARDRGLAVRVDPATNRVTARIRLRGSPFELEAGAGAVWATGNFTRREDVLHRIDPATERVVATVPLPGRHAGPLATGAGSVWVVVSNAQATSYSLVRIDSGTNRVADTWPLRAASHRWVQRIAVGHGAVWLLALRLGRRWELPGDVIRFDPRTGGTAAIEARALTMGLGPGGLWVTGCTVCRSHRTSYFARRIDTSTNKLAGRRIVRTGVGFGPLFVGRSRVWFGGYGRSSQTVAFRLDPQTGRIDRFLRLGTDLYTDMAFDSRARRLWVARATGSLLRVDLRGR